jgi:sarcosine oxidase subunit gamma
VADVKLAPTTGLETQVAALRKSAATGAGVTLSLRQDLAIASVIARKGMHDVLADRVRTAYGLSLPGPLARAGAGSVAFVWTAPDQWLATSERTDPAPFEATLRTALSASASVSNQSDGRTIVRVGGPKAREALAKGVPLDLHPDAFKPGHAASTMVAHIGVTFWQLDDRPSYEFAVFRSFAVAFWDFLVEASAEFGVSAGR